MNRFVRTMAILAWAGASCCAKADVIQCVPHYAKEGAKCSATGAANRSGWAIRSNVLTAEHLYVGGLVRWNSAGRIEQVGCADVKTDERLLDCPGEVVAPGFINLHEHLNFGADKPLPPPAHPLSSHRDWQDDPSLWGGKSAPWTLSGQLIGLVELRHLLSGTTTIAGRARAKGLTRNPDAGWFASVANITFPFGKHGLASSDHCRDRRILSGKKPTLVHAGEGTDAESRAEIACLLDNREALAQSEPLTLVHAMAVDEPLAARMKGLDVSIVWSPRSNMFLYAATAPVDVLLRAGVSISLGTDWLLSGSATLLDEARYAQSLSMNGKALSDDLLMDMMTTHPAAAIGMRGQLGELSVGAYADMVGFKLHEGDDPKRNILSSDTHDVSLVLVDGKLKFVGEGASVALDTFVPKSDCAVLPETKCAPNGYACGARSLKRALKRPDAAEVLCPVTGPVNTKLQFGAAPFPS
jgi:cytosine/adenosine deaminase-related metal-dependent hydrolase